MGSVAAGIGLVRNARSIGSGLFGSGSNSGALGTGQFQAGRYDIDRSAFDPNAQEASFTNYLQAQAMGTGGPSAAELQLRQGADMATNQAYALAASQRGVNPAMAARLAQSGGAQALQQANQQAGIMRAQEQLNSQGLFGNLLGDQRQGRMAREQLGVQQQTGINQVNQAGYEGAAGRRQGMMQGIGQGMTQAMMMSDENQKKNVSSGNNEIQSFLNSIGAEKYNYKNPSHGQGTFVSPMAQDLEKTSLGKGMVVDTPEGKVVDYGKGFGAMLAAQASLNERLNKIEGKKMNSGGIVEENSKAIDDQLNSWKPPEKKKESGGGSADMMAMFSKMSGGMNNGGMIPGKPKVKGDSVKNDTVPVMLSPGELVIPRTVVKEGPDAIKAFAQSIMKKKGSKDGKKSA